MTFYTFMTRNYKNSDSPAGDLARDMKSDYEKFPRNRPCKFNGWHKLIRKYLEENDACTGCLETFEKCWKEYVQCEKKRLKRN
nr:MAG TPA: YozE [Bacteriophage sp.]